MIANYLIKHAYKVISVYRGNTPLNAFLKDYFKNHKNAGSKDRKKVAEIVFAWFRLGKSLFPEITNTTSYPSEEQLINCYKIYQEFVLNVESEISVEEFLHNKSINLETLLPHPIQFSSGIEKRNWLNSFLFRPRVFIRTRFAIDRTIGELAKNNIEFKKITENCISFQYNVKLDSILPPDSYVIQDVSSQKTGYYFEPLKREQWLDICCGAGGKALLLKDMEPNVQLTVCDLRKSILANLEERFRLYKHQLTEIIVADATKEESLSKSLSNKLFDNIICDVPCSGSGTWARTPEQLYFFQLEQLNKLTEVQLKIVMNAFKYIRKGGKLFYITCSVFKDENEGVVNKFLEKTGMKLMHSELINGIDLQGDSMFLSIIEKT